MNRHEIIEAFVEKSESMDPRKRRDLLRELMKRVPDMDLYPLAAIIGITADGQPS